MSKHSLMAGDKFKMSKIACKVGVDDSGITDYLALGTLAVIYGALPFVS